MPESASPSKHLPTSSDMPIDEATRQHIARLENTIANQQTMIAHLKEEISSLVDDMRLTKRH